MLAAEVAFTGFFHGLLAAADPIGWTFFTLDHRAGPLARGGQNSESATEVDPWDW